MSRIQERIGKACVALVVGEGEAAQALITTVVARVLPKRARKYLRTTGPVKLHTDLVGHLHEVILPVVDGIVAQLGLDRLRSYEIAVLNHAAMSSIGRSTCVHGHSLDAAACCALVSARCQIPMSQDMVYMGELTPAGEALLPVGQLEAKLNAASEHPAIMTVVGPPCDQDPSLRRLLPALAHGVESSLRQSRAKLTYCCASDVETLLAAAFSETAIIEGAIRSGYFAQTNQGLGDATSVERAATRLGADTEVRFWAVLEDSLLSADLTTVKRLLRLLVQSSVRRRLYPRNIGHSLLQLLTCVPQSVLHVAGAFPLLEDHHLLALQQRARIDDGEDLDCLRSAIMGRIPTTAATVHARDNGEPEDSDGAASLASILVALSAGSLAQQVEIPIDEARLNYTLTDLTVDAPEAVEDAVARYYLFVLRRLGFSPDSSNPHYRAEAVALLERAFADRGGSRGAEVEGMSGTHGGLRSVLDALTDQLKREYRERHVRRIYEVLIRKRPWKVRLAIATGLYKRVKPHLAQDLQDLDPAELVEHIPRLIEVYVLLTSQLQSALRHATLRGAEDVTY